MKILYAIQGTGNGHLSRAKEILPTLKKEMDIDVMISGYQSNLDLGLPIKFRYRGMSYIFGHRGGIKYLESFRKLKLGQLWYDIKHLDLSDYDAVISDFEPISKWAAHRQGIPAIGLSHQVALLSPHSPKPKTRFPFFQRGIKLLSPHRKKIGFHFQEYDDFILTPIIRSEIRELRPSSGPHITVYLPAYHSDQISAVAEKMDHLPWHIFDKHSSHYKKRGHIQVFPVSEERWLESLAGARAVIMGAGFEGPSEALHLRKPLLTIPMRGQPEQKHNAAALSELGIPQAQDMNKEIIPLIEKMLHEDYVPALSFPDNTKQIVSRILHLLEETDLHSTVPQ